MKKKMSPELLEQLSGHPELESQIVRMLEMVTLADGKMKRADDVEETMIDINRELGSIVLRDWAENQSVKASEVHQESTEGSIANGKKN